jgi:hypothetical protein
MIFFIMFAIVTHTNRINNHTIMMIKQAEEQQARRKQNRRTGNFGKRERPTLDESGRVVAAPELTINKSQSSGTELGESGNTMQFSMPQND